jgi:hypothetical protein
MMSCHRNGNTSVDELRRALQKLNAQIIRNTAALAELDPLANEIAHDCAALKSAITEARIEAEEWQRQSHELQNTMTVTAHTGVLPERIIPGAQLDSINAGGKFYRDVRVDSISSKGVLIHHADGVARLNPVDVLGHHIAPPPSTNLQPRHTPAQTNSSPSLVSAEKPSPKPPHYLCRPSIPIPPNRKPHGKEIEVLAWWGTGSPYTTKIRDAFGNSMTAIRPGGNNNDDRPGPWIAGRSSIGRTSGSRRLSGHSSMTGYRPIGWNYRGSTLDYIYGRRP